jgi:hypothetical protein
MTVGQNAVPLAKTRLARAKVGSGASRMENGVNTRVFLKNVFMIQLVSR